MRKNTFRGLMAAVMMIIGFGSSNAQYYAIANQVTNLLSPALSGSGRYKGFVEVSGLAGIGENRANFIGVSTTQGYQYNDWFYMGAGMGIDVVMAHQSDALASMSPDSYPGWYTHSSSKTKAMIPVFTDLRVNLGSRTTPSFFIDVKFGAAWLLGSSYLQMESSRMTNGTQFYLRPSVGVRIPVSKSDNRQAFNIGLTYQLLTSNNFYGWNNNSASLNNVGLTLGYEW